MNEKAKKELNNEDLKVLSGILSKSNEVLTKEDREHLTARRAYLTKEELETYKIKEEVEETVTDPDPVETEEVDAPVNDPVEEVPADYSGLNKEALIKECKKRNIEVTARDTKEALIELIEADDKGELVEEE